MSYTSQHLLDAIGRRSFAPTGQRTFEDAELLATADEIAVNEVIPMIVSVREEFFVTSVDVPIIAGQNAYPIPARAQAMVVRDVWLVDGANVNPNFPRKEPEDVTSDAPGTPSGFYLRYNDIIIHPTPASTAKSLRIFFFLTNSRLVLPAAAAVVSAFDPLTGVVTVSAIPSAWSTGLTFDLIKQDGGQEPIALDQTSLLVAGTDITFASLPGALRVGDYVALAGETPLVALPDLFRPALAQGVAAEILEDMNQPGAEKSTKKFEKMMATAAKSLVPRTQGEDRKITPKNWF